MSIKPIFHCLFLVLFCIGKLGFSQSYNFDYYSVDKGLSQSQINCLLEDSRGFLWCGTSGGGLCQFDGKNFTSYNSKNDLDGQIVKTIVESKNGDIVIGTTWGGVEFFDGEKFSQINEKDNLLDNCVNTLFVDYSGIIWVGTNKGLSLIQNKKVIQLPYFKELINIKITSIAQDEKGVIWICSDNGLYIYSRSLGLSKPDFKLPINEDVKQLYSSPTGEMIFVTKDNKVYLSNYLNNNLIDNRLFYFSDSIQQYSITCVAFDNSSKIYLFGTNKNGLLKVNREHFSHIGENEGLKKTVVNSILIGRDNILWIGANGEGLISLRSKAFLRYDKINQKTVSSIFSICEMENEIWLSSMNNQILKITDKGLAETPIGKIIQYSRAILYDKERKVLWIGSEKGLYSYHNNKLEHFFLNNLEPNISIKSLYLLSDGTLAVGTEGSGLYLYNGKQFTKIKAPLPAKSYIHSLLEDDDGDLWVGTGNFAYKINLKTGKYTHFVYEFCNSYIGSMTKDNLGRIWFGTDRCVNMYDGKKFHTFNQESGLNSSIIYFVYADKSGNIWVGTNNGLNKIVSNRKGKIIQILNYNENKGFYGVECNTNACFCDKNGDMWFGTVNGLFKYLAKYDIYKKDKPLIYITGVRILHQAKEFKSSDESTNWFHLPKNPVLSYNQNNLSFEFISIFKSSPFQIEYAYKLKGFDRNWMRLENGNSINYSNLEPGNYTFLVRAKNQDGIWSNTSAYSFQIKTPFWQEWWFYLIVFALVTYTIIALVKIREKRRTTFQKMLEKTVKERTKEITLQKEEIELLLKEVHHRVKNNMQVINSLINLQSSFIEDKKALLLFEDCKNRIHSMALIHEKLYESKDLKNVSIQEYVSNLINHLISTYEIHKKVHLKESIEVSNFSLDIIIPLGLIINEIVSNSLKHAFKEAENEAENTIYFSLKSIGIKQFEMIVGDNGNGFNHAVFYQEEGTLGIELIKILSEQVNGTMEILKQKGTFYRLVFSE